MALAGIILYRKASPAEKLISCYPGWALMEVKWPRLRLFIRKGDQIQSLQQCQGSQICPLLHDDDCGPGLYFSGEGPDAGSFSLWAGCRVCPSVREITVSQHCLPSERKHQSAESRSVLTRDQMPWWWARYTLTLPAWEQFRACWCQLSRLRHWVSRAAVPSHSLALNQLQLSYFCGLIFPPQEPLHQSSARENRPLTSLNDPRCCDCRIQQLLFQSSRTSWRISREFLSGGTLYFFLLIF